MNAFYYYYFLLLIIVVVAYHTNTNTIVWASSSGRHVDSLPYRRMARKNIIRHAQLAILNYHKGHIEMAQLHEEQSRESFLSATRGEERRLALLKFKQQQQDKEALESSEEFYQAYIDFGIFLQQRHHYQEALKCFSKAQEAYALIYEEVKTAQQADPAQHSVHTLGFPVLLQLLTNKIAHAKIGLAHQRYIAARYSDEQNTTEALLQLRRKEYYLPHHPFYESAMIDLLRLNVTFIAPVNTTTTSAAAAAAAQELYKAQGTAFNTSVASLARYLSHDAQTHRHGCRMNKPHTNDASKTSSFMLLHNARVFYENGLWPDRYRQQVSTTQEERRKTNNNTTPFSSSSVYCIPWARLFGDAAVAVPIGTCDVLITPTVTQSVYAAQEERSFQLSPHVPLYLPTLPYSTEEEENDENAYAKWRQESQYHTARHRAGRDTLFINTKIANDSSPSPHSLFPQQEVSILHKGVLETVSAHDEHGMLKGSFEKHPHSVKESTLTHMEDSAVITFSLVPSTGYYLNYLSQVDDLPHNNNNTTSTRLTKRSNTVFYFVWMIEMLSSLMDAKEFLLSRHQEEDDVITQSHSRKTIFLLPLLSGLSASASVHPPELKVLRWSELWQRYANRISSDDDYYYIPRYVLDSLHAILEGWFGVSMLKSEAFGFVLYPLYGSDIYNTERFRVDVYCVAPQNAKRHSIHRSTSSSSSSTADDLYYDPEEHAPSAATLRQVQEALTAAWAVPPPPQSVTETARKTILLLWPTSLHQWTSTAKPSQYYEKLFSAICRLISHTFLQHSEREGKSMLHFRVVHVDDNDYGGKDMWKGSELEVVGSSVILGLHQYLPGWANLLHFATRRSHHHVVIELWEEWEAVAATVTEFSPSLSQHLSTTLQSHTIIRHLAHSLQLSYRRVVLGEKDNRENDIQPLEALQRALEEALLTEMK